jgi:N-acetylglucosamine kinase-like BadF-type ATPase
MKLFLGVDGGATKTVATVINESGKIISRASGRQSNYHSIGIKRAEENLYELIKKLGKRKISCACFGMAGIDSEKDYRIVYSSFNRRIKKSLNCPIFLLNDSKIVLPSIGVENGVAVTGGTGCNFYARNGRKEARASGLGHILADEGSAFEIAVKVLRAAVRSFDGRGEKSILEKMVLEKAKSGNIRNLVNVIYKNPEKSMVAAYAPLAEKAALKGDKIAREILSAAANEYILGIRAVSKRAGLRRFKIAMIGGVFNAKHVLEKVKSEFPEARFFIVKDSSIGAANLAMKEFQRLHS